GGGPGVWVRPVAGSVRSEVPRPELDPLGRSLYCVNELAPPFATLGYLHGPPPGESPIGAWATRSPAKRRVSDRTEPQTEPDVTPGAALSARFRRHGSGVRCCQQKDPWRMNPSGVMHQRRTVGLGIPCPVARLPSRTPLPQAQGVEPGAGKAQGEAAMVRLGTPARAERGTQHAGQGRVEARGQDAPEESNNKIRASP